MAYILFVADPGEEFERMQHAAEFFGEKGHRTEVVPDGHRALVRIRANAPDLLVCHNLGGSHHGVHLGRELRASWPIRKTGVILFFPQMADVGGSLGLIERCHDAIDHLIIPPPEPVRKTGMMGFHFEQLVACIGLLLYKLGLELPPRPAHQE